MILRGLNALWGFTRTMCGAPKLSAHDLAYLPDRIHGRSLARDWPHSRSAVAAPATEHNPLRTYFENLSEGPGIYKWLHYFDIYHRHLARFVQQPVVLVEVGIYSGGSLGMWHHYFGSQCHVHGIDIQPACKIYATPNTSIHIGDQGDHGFWQDFYRQTGDVDIVIDDGSHKPEHQIITLEESLPRLKPGGVYICEDVHGLHNRFSAYLHALCDGLNTARLGHNAAGEWSSPVSPLQSRIASVTLYPFLAVIEMRTAAPVEWTSPKRGSQWQPFMS